MTGLRWAAVLGVLVLLGAVLWTAARPGSITGTAVAGPPAGPPAAGDCLLEDPWLDDEADRTSGPLPALRVAPCTGARYGEVVSVSAATDLDAMWEDGSWDQCWRAIDAYLGLPQVVVPGCVDFACFGPRQAVPESLRGRPAYYHNPEFTLVRLDRDEMATVGATMARKLSAARGPVTVLVPLGGLSIPNVPGGAFYDPEADAAFRDALRAGLRPDIPIREIDAHVNDAAFATAVAEAFLDLLEPTAGRQGDKETRRQGDRE